MTLIIKAATPEEARRAIVKIIDGWASNERIKARNAKLVAFRDEATNKAHAYEGAARMIEKMEIRE